MCVYRTLHDRAFRNAAIARNQHLDPSSCLIGTSTTKAYDISLLRLLFYRFYELVFIFFVGILYTMLFLKARVYKVRNTLFL